MLTAEGAVQLLIVVKVVPFVALQVAVPLPLDGTTNQVYCVNPNNAKAAVTV